MKISIGLRLFLSVLLAILAVTASAVWLLRQTVLEGFGDYAVQIELDRLEGLSNELARRHAAAGSWRFVPRRDTARRAWLRDELARLQEVRSAAIAPAAPALPAAPAAPATPAAPVLPASRASLAAPASPAAPVAPPSPPALAPPAPTIGHRLALRPSRKA
ncbi:hypothetical protein LK540_18175 [Massilia sp. IC2-278]|uniref:hypothetical protein n=1 Tax=Massilia sp. IC2-278 TaxID=2887200 RepID=UPI001E524D68|nr:hypothetical protein [Massilia sp. IC2-278]MCC2962357.1 hypothetical protein [Massilia sp. IC2-278]